MYAAIARFAKSQRTDYPAYYVGNMYLPCFSGVGFSDEYSVHTLRCQSLGVNKAF